MTTTIAPAQFDIDSVHEHFTLYDVDWKFYESVLKKVGDRHVFVTYDRGRLELMSPSWEHDKSAELLGLIVRALAERLDMSIAGGGSTTFQRKDLERGLEPDKCFYIKNEHRIRGKKRIDLNRDPPPDLAIEIEISRRLLDREAIYAALGVPELWRFDGSTLRVLQLSRGKYRACDRSPTFPQVPLEQIERFLEQSHITDETIWMRKVSQWARRHLA